MAYSLKSCGIINALGSGCEEVWSNLFLQEKGSLSQSDEYFEEREVFVGRINTEILSLPTEMKEYESRNNRILYSAYKQIEGDVKGLIREFGAERIGVVIGTSTSGIAEGEKAIAHYLENEEFPAEYNYSQQEIASPAKFLSKVSNVLGPSYSVSTACSSSAKVFASARRLLSNNLCDAVILGGADSLCHLTLHGFSSLDLVSRSICKPMSKNRDGINIGEGACLMIMTRGSEGVELLGIGESSDAYHTSSPEPEGRGAYESMKAAIEDAGITVKDVAYINMHGTSTTRNDSMESKAIFRLFKDEIFCSSTKPYVGHMLGASGVTEIAFCWLMLSKASNKIDLIVHDWDGVRDPEIPKLKLVERGDSVEISKKVRLMSNSFAFGGSNCSVILQKTY